MRAAQPLETRGETRVRGSADFFIGGSRRTAFENGEKRGEKEIIERPRAAIDANKALGRADALARSEEMRRVISLLDLDSFLRPRVSRSPLSLSLSRFTERRRRREIYRAAYLGSWRLFVYRYHSVGSGARRALWIPP